MGLPLLLAIGTAGGILRLNQRSDDCRRTQVDLGRIRALAYKFHGCEEQAVAEKAVTEETADEEEQADREMDAALLSLFRSHPRNPRLAAIDDAYRAYDLALDVEFASIRKGDLEGGEKIATARVDPAFNGMLRAIAEANAFFDAHARQENRLADVGTAGILLLGAALLSAFFVRIERARRREAMQAALEQREAHIHALISHVSDIIAVLDADYSVRFLSEAAERLLRCPTDSLLSASLLSLVHADDHNAAQKLLGDAVRDQTEAGCELRLRDVEGNWLTFEVVATNLLAEPHVQGLLVTFRDITERKSFEARIAHQAFHDALTGLPNRVLFMDRLHSALARSQRHSKLVGVLFVDLDNFKVINDSLGHEAGDTLLKAIAERLQTCVRPGDTVARLGGDEFTLLLEDLSSDQDATQIAERIFQQLKLPIALSGHEVFAGASVGIAVTPEGANDADGLMRDADTAMYQAKTSGKSSYVVFERSMNDRVMERLELENGLRRALEQGEFRLLYQPILDMETGAINGAEALVRWEHPKLGLVSPAKFIPLAEETGLIVPIGAWVLKEACRQARVWQETQENSRHFVMSVNLSGRQLQNPDLVATVAGILEETGLEPCRLKLEITESVMMEDVDATIDKLQQLKALGVLLAVDDFGTGYSSLSYLRRLPVDTVKIDRSFVSTLGAETQPAAIVNTIIMLCRALNLSVTGEGIENSDQVAQLQSLGCDLGQGYHFSKPIAVADFEALLKRGGIAPEVSTPVEPDWEQILRPAA